MLTRLISLLSVVQNTIRIIERLLSENISLNRNREFRNSYTMNNSYNRRRTPSHQREEKIVYYVSLKGNLLICIILLTMVFGHAYITYISLK